MIDIFGNIVLSCSLKMCTGNYSKSMSLEIVNRALDFEKLSALFTISSDMHQSVCRVYIDFTFVLCTSHNYYAYKMITLVSK